MTLPAEEQENLRLFQRRFLILSLLVLAALFIVVFIAGLLFQKEIIYYCQWVVDQFGFTPMAITVFFSDTFLSPVPPDLFLLIIANSDLKENWLFYCFILSVVSMLAGFTGWTMGRLLSHHKWMPNFIKESAEKHREKVNSYGTWAVAIGALTPFPFSITCWTAGLAHLPLKKLILGAFMRFPRIYIYYWAIESAVWVPAHLPQ